MSSPRIRAALQADVPAILEIYAPIVTGTAISFELEVPSLQEMTARFQKVTAKHPYLVAECEGEVCGYAYATTFRDRPAYDRTCELSVYIKQGHRHQGLGRLLYSALIQDLGIRGFKEIIAGTTVPNPPSEQFHIALGFTQVGTFKRVGHKFEKWWDVAFFQLSLPDQSQP